MQYIIIAVAVVAALLLGGYLLGGDKQKAGTDQNGSATATEQLSIATPDDPKVAAFMANTDQNPGLVTTDSGLQYAVLQSSESEQYPNVGSMVEVHYHGTLENGEVFDSSVLRGESISFPLGGVIRGWQEGIPLMNVGSKYRLIVPADLAYGPLGNGHPLGGQTLIFDVELISIQ